MVRTDAFTIHPAPGRQVAWSRVPVRKQYLDREPSLDLTNLWVI